MIAFRFDLRFIFLYTHLSLKFPFPIKPFLFLMPSHFLSPSGHFFSLLLLEIVHGLVSGRGFNFLALVLTILYPNTSDFDSNCSKQHTICEAAFQKAFAKTEIQNDNVKSELQQTYILQLSTNYDFKSKTINQ